MTAFAEQLRQSGHVVRTPDLFLYKGSGHLFSDSSLAAYDPEAAASLMRRVLDFLARG